MPSTPSAICVAGKLCNTTATRNLHLHGLRSMCRRSWGKRQKQDTETVGGKKGGTNSLTPFPPKLNVGRGRSGTQPAPTTLKQRAREKKINPCHLMPHAGHGDVVAQKSGTRPAEHKDQPQKHLFHLFFHLRSSTGGRFLATMETNVLGAFLLAGRHGCDAGRDAWSVMCLPWSMAQTSYSHSRGVAGRANEARDMLTLPCRSSPARAWPPGPSP